MKDVSLLISTGNEKVDRTLRGLVGIFETTFPDRLRSYYIYGSYSDNSYGPGSDVDLTIFFKERFRDEEEKRRAKILVQSCLLLSAVELDLEVVDEEYFARGVDPALKLGGVLLYGENIDDKLKLILIDDWASQRMHAVYTLMCRLFSRSPDVFHLLDYPDPDGEFYGYDRRKLRLEDGREVNCTRDLIRIVGWAATALIAFKGGRYVTRKADYPRIYRETINDEWTELIEEIYQKCRQEWNYLIPESTEERLLLRDLCRRTRDFENHFLLNYRDFVLDQKQSTL